MSCSSCPSFPGNAHSDSECRLGRVPGTGDLYDDPVIFECGHSFCEKCVRPPPECCHTCRGSINPKKPWSHSLHSGVLMIDTAGTGDSQHGVDYQLPRVIQKITWHLRVVETKKLLGICTSKIASFVIHMLQNQGWVLCSAIAIPAFFFFSHDFIWGKYVVVDTIIHFRVSG
eukprot:GHVN01017409.1.p1 GENE.GHVN01017409.1~~GHVN01017409.1.p1  ORF type:complete len:172 (-),score=1.17 GHVN01017409.1:105-620(-)